MKNNKPKLLFVVTEDWYFHSHRKPMAMAAIEAGFDVHLITQTDKHKAQIEDWGITIHEFSFDRKSLNPIKALGQIGQLRTLYKQLDPAIIHHIAMKPILYGSIAALGMTSPQILNAFAGLGFVFSADTPKAKIIKSILVPLFWLTLKGKNRHLLFQNRDDTALFKSYGLINDDQTHIIKGSGVDMDDYPYLPAPERKPEDDLICAFAGRMIGIKGLPTLKETFEILETEAPHIKLWLCGTPDPHNPGAWTQQDLQEWGNKPNIKYLGHQSHMADIWKQAHVGIQLSYGGEGIPKSLLEAAACGKPIIATASAGCREMVTENNQNGYIVNIKDARETANKLIQIASDNQIEPRGKASRALVESEMTAKHVTEKAKKLYKSLAAI